MPRIIYNIFSVGDMKGGAVLGSVVAILMTFRIYHRVTYMDVVESKPRGLLVESTIEIDLE